MTQKQKKDLMQDVFEKVVSTIDGYAVKKDLAEYYSKKTISDVDGTKSLRYTLVERDAFHCPRDENDDSGSLYIHINILEPREPNRRVYLNFCISPGYIDEADEVVVPSNVVRILAEIQRRLDKYNKERFAELKREKKLEDSADFREWIEN